LKKDSRTADDGQRKGHARRFGFFVAGNKIKNGFQLGILD
jgi:hypothetical protein